MPGEQGKKPPAAYGFQIKGHLDNSWTEWFDDMVFDHKTDGTTNLTGPIIDQAALQGNLTKIKNLGLELISVKPIEPRPKDD